MTKSLVLPIAVVTLWVLLIIGLSTSLGSWEHTQMVLLYTLSKLNPGLSEHLSPGVLNQINFLIRKLAHFSEYAILFSLAYWMSRKGFKLAKAIALPLVLACIILFAISDEVHQSFVPGRTPHVRDVLIDSAGASTIALIALKFDRPSSAADDPVEL